LAWGLILHRPLRAMLRKRVDWIEAAAKSSAATLGSANAF
jgi:hypothetical protein